MEIMSELQFDESVTQRVATSRNESGLNEWLIKNGLASSESSANLILVTVSGIFILVSVFIFALGQSSLKNEPVPEMFSQDITFEERRNIVKSLPKDVVIPLKESDEN